MAHMRDVYWWLDQLRLGSSYKVLEPMGIFSLDIGGCNIRFRNTSHRAVKIVVP